MVFEHGPNEENLSHMWAPSGTEQKDLYPCSTEKTLV